MSKEPCRRFAAFTVCALLATQSPTAAKVIHAFVDPAQGLSSYAPLIADDNGTLYGTTSSGGSAGFGTVFRLARSAPGQAWVLATLYNFQGGIDGTASGYSLSLDANGTLYGTTQSGGSFTAVCSGGCGTAYKLAAPAQGQTSWVKTTITSFADYPSSGLLPDPASGVLYGTTAGVASPGGTIFMLAPPAIGQSDWTQTTLHQFKYHDPHGDSPSGNLIIDKDGSLIGTTVYGGIVNCSIGGCGTVFSLKRPKAGQAEWRLRVLYTFTGGPNSSPTVGSNPGNGVIPDGEGGLFGTTSYGYIGIDLTNRGTVFHLSRPQSKVGPWTITVIHVFDGPPDGAGPSPLVQDRTGNLFGTTVYGGSRCPAMSECGTLFELSPPMGGGSSWTEALIDQRPAGGTNPAGVLLGRDGYLYETTSKYGPLPGGAGTINRCSRMGF